MRLKFCISPETDIDIIIYCGFSAKLSSSSIKSDKITVPFALLRSLILLFGPFELHFFDSLLRSSWDARLTSRITDIESLTRFSPPNKKP